MAMLNIPTIAPTLNQIVAEIQTQFENQTDVYRAINRRGKKDFVNGKGERIPSYLQRPTGISAITEGGSFNPPGLPVWDDMFLYPAEVALPYQLSDRVIRNFNAGSEYTQIKGMSEYLARIADALTKDLERTMFGDGTGLKGTLSGPGSAAGAITTLSFTSTAAATWGQTKGAVWVEIGEVYDVVNAATGVVRGQVKFGSKTATTATTTSSSFDSTTIVAGDYIVTQNGLNNFPRGFAYIINNDTGIFQLLSRATYGQLRANVVDAGGGAVTVSDFHQSLALMDIRGDSLSTSRRGKAAWMSIAQHDALLRLGQNLKRFGGDVTKFDGSFQEFGFGDVTINRAVDCDEDRIYFCDLDDLVIVEEKPFGVYQSDGLQLRMMMGTAGVGSAAFVGAMGVAYQFGAYQPRKHTLLKRLSTTGLPTQVLAYT